VELSAGDVARLVREFNIGDNNLQNAVAQIAKTKIALHNMGRSGPGAVGGAIDSLRRVLTRARSAEMTADNMALVESLIKARDVTNAVIGDK
jgi:hypothetical protein